MVPGSKYQVAQKVRLQHDLENIVEPQQRKTLARDLRLEDKSNEEDFEKRIGKFLFYGDEIQLRHYASGKYLTVHRSDLAKVETTSARKVELCSFPTEGVSAVV